MDQAILIYGKTRQRAILKWEEGLGAGSEVTLAEPSRKTPVANLGTPQAPTRECTPHAEKLACSRAHYTRAHEKENMVERLKNKQKSVMWGERLDPHTQTCLPSRHPLTPRPNPTFARPTSDWELREKLGIKGPGRERNSISQQHSLGKSP